MAHRERMLANTARLIEGCNILQVPIFLTEQYPRGLGTTESVLFELLEVAGTPEFKQVSALIK